MMLPKQKIERKRYFPPDDPVRLADDWIAH